MLKETGFAGKTVECLKHFSQTHKLDQSDRKTYRRRNRICDLLGIAKTTGFRWFGKHELPVGENLLRLQFFLELVGYQVAERQCLLPSIRELADQIALSLIAIDETAQRLETMTDTIFRWTLGKSEPIKETIPLLDNLVMERRSLVAEQLTKWHAELTALGLDLGRMNTVEVDQEKAAVPTSVIDSTKPTDQQKEVVLRALAAQLKAIKPLAELVLSDTFSAADRIHLRQLASHNGGGHSHDVFAVSNLLNRLCGERARKEL